MSSITEQDAQTADDMIYPPIPEAHLKAARIAQALLVPVSHDDAEQLPDPDYGL